MRCELDRYWLFAGDDYEERGGMFDFVASSNSEDVLSRVADTMYDDRSQWWHIFDTQEQAIVSHNEGTGSCCLPDFGKVF